MADGDDWRGVGILEPSEHWCTSLSPPALPSSTCAPRPSVKFRQFLSAGRRLKVCRYLTDKLRP
jgi:hypothetical protein